MWLMVSGSLSEAGQSSTWRKLRAVRMVLESFQSKLKNERVRWFTDNQNVVRIVQCGSKQPSLQIEVLGIFSACVSNNIRIKPEWIPRDRMSWRTIIATLLITMTGC